MHFNGNVRTLICLHLLQIFIDEQAQPRLQKCVKLVKSSFSRPETWVVVLYMMNKRPMNPFLA